LAILKERERCSFLLVPPTTTSNSPVV